MCSPFCQLSLGKRSATLAFLRFLTSKLKLCLDIESLMPYLTPRALVCEILIN